MSIFVKHLGEFEIGTINKAFELWILKSPNFPTVFEIRQIALEQIDKQKSAYHKRAKHFVQLMIKSIIGLTEAEALSIESFLNVSGFAEELLQLKGKEDEIRVERLASVLESIHMETRRDPIKDVLHNMCIGQESTRGCNFFPYIVFNRR